MSKMDPLSKDSPIAHTPQKEQGKLHIIEKVEATLVLRTCFEPLFKIMVPLGILPVHINGIGWASYRPLLQPQSVFYLFSFSFFTFVTCIYAPFYIKAMEMLGNTFTFSLAKYLFVGGQHLTAAVTLLMIPVLSGRVTKLWNRLQQLVVQITSCHSAKQFARVYRLVRVIIVLWLLVVMSSWYLWWKCFFESGYFQIYFKSSQGSTSYYFHVLGCITMATLISSHVLHSIFFITLAATMRMCFRTISKRAKKHECHLPGAEGFNEKLSQRKVCSELADAFVKASKLVSSLGHIYGRYMILEMFAFFSSALTSIFALCDNFKVIQPDAVIITLVINITWFWGVCECGQMLQDEHLACLRSMKGVALKYDMPANWMIEKFTSVKLTGLTAANYFTFSRSLVTGAVVSLVTYLIVMLQFRAADKTNQLIQLSADKIENFTRYGASPL